MHELAAACETAEQDGGLSAADNPVVVEVHEQQIVQFSASFNENAHGRFVHCVFANTCVPKGYGRAAPQAEHPERQWNSEVVQDPLAQLIVLVEVAHHQRRVAQVQPNGNHVPRQCHADLP